MTARRAYRLLAPAAALAWLLATAWLVRSQASGRLSDFAAFYAGGRLVGTGQLYDAARLQQIEKATTGSRSRAHGFVRPPFQALLFGALARLPYETAEVVWAALTVGALLGFAYSWPDLDRGQRLRLTCISLPASIGVANGQDSAMMLLVVTASVALQQRNRPAAAGMVFSLCAAKAQLFLLLPLLILRRREYGFGGGLLAGGAALVGMSTLAAGWSWPIEMWETVTNPAFSPDASLMPNLVGALNGGPSARLIYALGAAALASSLWRFAPRVPFPAALAVTIAASLPLAPHSYFPDCVLLLPAVCVAIRSDCRRVRLPGYFFATPLPFITLFFDWPYSSFTALAMLLFAVLTAQSPSRPADWRQTNPPARRHDETRPACR